MARTTTTTTAWQVLWAGGSFFLQEKAREEVEVNTKDATTSGRAAKEDLDVDYLDLGDSTDRTRREARENSEGNREHAGLAGVLDTSGATALCSSQPRAGRARAKAYTA